MKMQMVYNISYEVSGLVLLLIVSAHINFDRIIRSYRNRFFLVFVWVGILDIVFDLVSTIMITNPHIYSAVIQMIFLEALYVMQLLLPFILYLYILSLQNPDKKRLRSGVILASIPFACMLFVVLINPWAKCLFSFDENNLYVKENFYSLMYIYGILYMLLCLTEAVIHRKRVERKYTRIIYESCVIVAVTVAIQMMYNEILLTGFGIAACTIILLLTLQNPNEKIDKLTSAYELDGFREILQLLQSKQENIWLVTLSLDNLKRINHVFGMENGDRVLVEVAAMLRKGMPETSVFRFLGDRFAVITLAEEEYSDVCNRINAFFNKSHHINRAEYRLSACICTIPNFKIEGRINDFIGFLDYFIEETKAKGPGSYAEMSGSIQEKYERYRQIDEYLYQAVEENLFEVNYQPIFSAKNNCFASIEALARLTHPELGSISPAEFIPIAEKNGLISSIDRCVFTKVCQFLSEHRELFTKLKTVKFNLSAADLLNERLIKIILTIIARYELNPKGFQFEITETVATQYGDELARLVQDLKSMGCGICLDDFGSGYANLDSVLNIPFDAVKMDRSMLVAAVQSQRAEAFYQNIIRVLTDLQYEIIAEGAETLTQVDFLKNSGVDYIQGYYYSKPLSESELLKFI